VGSLPEHALLLLVGALLLFVPGGALARLLGVTRCLPAPLLPAAAFTGSMALLSAVTWFTLTLDLSIRWNATIYSAIGVALLALCIVRPGRDASSWRPIQIVEWAEHLPVGLWAVLLATAILAWIVGGSIMSDSLYHAAQALKLASLHHPNFDNTLQYRDGGPHPGYLLPVWQQLIALVSWITHADVLRTMKELPTVTVALEALTWGGLAQVAFRSRMASQLAALSFLLMQALATAPAFNPISNAMQPGELVVNVVMPLAVATLLVTAWGDAAGGPVEREHRIDPRLLGVLAVATAMVIVIHVSYIYFLGMTIAGYLALWLLHGPWTKGLVKVHAVACAVIGVVTVAGIGILLPTLNTLRTFAHEGGADFAKSFGDANDRADGAQIGVLFVGSFRHYHLRGDYLVWFGGLALAGLCCAVLALVLRRRPGAWYLAGTAVLVLGLSQSDVLFPHLVALTGPGQARRLDQALPNVIGLALGLTLLAALLEWGWGKRKDVTARALSIVAVGAALVVLLALVRHYPKLASRQDKPLIPEWPITAVLLLLGFGVLLSAVWHLWKRRQSTALDAPFAPGPTAAGIVALLLVVASLPALTRAREAIHRDLDRRPDRVYQMDELKGMSPAFVHQLRKLPVGSIVMADPRDRTSFRIMALAPVYVVSSVPGHTANTPKNDVERRWNTAVKYYASNTTEEEKSDILKREHVDAVVEGTQGKLSLQSTKGVASN
jgi:hypothetical protein